MIDLSILHQNGIQNCAFRTDFERRQALVEIDVLASMALGLTLEELNNVSIEYNFQLLNQYETRHLV